MENTLGTRPADRPERIDQIINSLEVYNIDATCSELEAYVTTQGVSDILASAALFKQYQINFRYAKDDVIIIALSKALLKFYSSDFSLLLHLLPPRVLLEKNGSPDSLASQAQKLFQLYELLDSYRFVEFWHKFESDDSYADIVADVNNFEDELRQTIASVVSVACKQIAVDVFQAWSNLSERKFLAWVSDTLKWETNGNMVIVPGNKENEAKVVVKSENVRFEQLSRVIRRAYEINL